VTLKSAKQRPRHESHTARISLRIARRGPLRSSARKRSASAVNSPRLPPVFTPPSPFRVDFIVSRGRARRDQRGLTHAPGGVLRAFSVPPLIAFRDLKDVKEAAAVSLKLRKPPRSRRCRLLLCNKVDDSAFPLAFFPPPRAISRRAFHGRARVFARVSGADRGAHRRVIPADGDARNDPRQFRRVICRLQLRRRRRSLGRSFVRIAD